MKKQRGHGNKAAKTATALNLPTVEELATSPPPRQFFAIPSMPSAAECERALSLQPGDPGDSPRLVFVAARIHHEGDAEDKLTFDFFMDGSKWPVPLRLAILSAYPRTLYFERRLAALKG